MTEKDEIDHTTKVQLWIGYASADRAKDDITIEVTIPELLPNLQGDLQSNTTTVTNTLQDSSGNQIQSQIDTSNSVEAKWFGESNRKYPPDVKKGEQLIILKFNNSDAYYWISPGRDMPLRTREVYRVEVANKADANSPLTDDNTYFVEIDSINKRCRIRTSKNDGEAHVYELCIDTKNSRVWLTDDVNNEILIESETPRVRMRNKDGSFLDLFQKNFILAAPQDGTIKADRQLVITAPVITTKATTMVMNAKAMTMKTNGWTVNAATAGITGSTKINGSLVTGPIRTPWLINGVVGTPYQDSTTDINNGTGNPQTPAADVVPNANNTSQDHAMSFEKVVEAMQIITDAFNQVQSSINVPTGAYTTLPAIANSGKLSNLQDKSG